MSDWHASSPAKTAVFLQSDLERGLAERVAAQRKETYGPNKLPEEKPPSSFRLFLRQLKSPLIFILLVAGAVTLLLAQWTDAAVIFAAVILNTGIGFAQEKRATRALSALQGQLSFRATVVRDEQEREVAAEDVVPGDLVILRPGFKVPADGRVVLSSNLLVGEAALTGEWLSSAKGPKTLAKDTSLADRDNMVYMGGVVESGTGTVLVTATGNDTELGNVASLVRKMHEETTPYQKRLDRFSWMIGGVVTLVAAFIFIQGTLTGGDPVVMFTTAVAVAVAAVPEGLPVAMTIILAVGMRRILGQKGLVRHLSSAETLGSSSVIATDKTLTLTQGTMRVAKVALRPKRDRKTLLSALALANEAFVEPDGTVRGRPTDRALLEYGIGQGYFPAELVKAAPRTSFVPFDAEKKYVASFHGPKVYVSGAPERVLELSRVSSQEWAAVHRDIEKFASRGLRVVALAAKTRRKPGPDLKNLAFLGLVGLQDPLRPDVKQAITRAKRAGIRTVIVTGDHMLTAREVARKLGLPFAPKNLLEGRDLQEMSDEALSEKLEEVSVFARVEPAHKLRIVEAWQGRGEVLAMTGDGVNDAPALKKADIGIALGSGTDVAKEVSDLVLLGDNFSIIPLAIKEGRVMIDNIRKVTTYLLSGVFTETILIGTALIFGLPLPVTALQILWINIVEDGLPGIALTFEKADKGVMKRRPEGRGATLLTSEMKVIIFVIGLVTDAVLLGLFLVLLETPYSPEHIQTVIFAGLAAGSLLYVFSVKNLGANIWQYSPFDNPFLTGSVLLGLLLILLPVYVPFLQSAFGTFPLTSLDWVVLGSFAVFNLVFIEAAKWYFIRTKRI